MPQLNPSPWLMIFLMAWSFFMIILYNKTINIVCPNEPTTKKLEKKLSGSWNWPWL